MGDADGGMIRHEGCLVLERYVMIPNAAIGGGAGPVPGHPGDLSPGLYVHIPFCDSRCTYCDFHTSIYRSQVAHRYLEALRREADQVAAEAPPPRTIFVGGGTPSALSHELFAELLEMLAERFRTPRLLEWTLEANPCSVDSEKAAYAHQYGVDRVSTGVQSFTAPGLALLGRRHSPEQVLESHRILREAGIPRLNLDLILGWPGQDFLALERDLLGVSQLAPEHVSLYHLSYEPGTWLTRVRDQGAIREPSDRHVVALGRRALAAFAEAGYTRYEVSSFAQPGEASLHNLNYWRRGEFRGIGSGAASFDGKRRWKNRPDIPAYIEWAGTPPREDLEELTKEQELEEWLLLSMRLQEGLDEQRLRRLVGQQRLAATLERAEQLRDQGFLERAEGRIWLTPRGFEVLDEVLLQLLVPMQQGGRPAKARGHDDTGESALDPFAAPSAIGRSDTAPRDSGLREGDLGR